MKYYKLRRTCMHVHDRPGTYRDTRTMVPTRGRENPTKPVHPFCAVLSAWLASLNARARLNVKAARERVRCIHAAAKRTHSRVPGATRFVSRAAAPRRQTIILLCAEQGFLNFFFIRNGPLWIKKKKQAKTSCLCFCRLFYYYRIVVNHIRLKLNNNILQTIPESLLDK